MADLSTLESMFQAEGFTLPERIKQDIAFNLSTNSYINKHVCFLYDLKTHKILLYDFNIYFKSDAFPFSIHSEVQAITKYYKNRNINKHKKALIVVKLSRTGLIGNSKCCLNCMLYVRNNFTNLGLKKILYSDSSGKLISLHKRDLVDEDFRPSKGFTQRQR